MAAPEHHDALEFGGTGVEPPAFHAGNGLHPLVDNRTPFVAEALLLADEHAHPVVTLVVKGTFNVSADTCRRADVQEPLQLEGELWGDDAATSSYKREPEIAFTKPATDVVVIGHAWAARGGTTELQVGIRIGSVQKHTVVYGDRVWVKTLGDISATKPIAFEKIPLRWERAFGGWDRSHPDKGRHGCDPCNPVGTGFRPHRIFEEGLRLPNIEETTRTLRSFGESVQPTGFGFVSPHWQPRAALAGTFDEVWQRERAPLLPRNFDRRHLNAAAPGLVADGYLRGDERVVVVGMAKDGPLRFALPAIRPPVVQAFFREGGAARSATQLDTVIVDVDAKKVSLLWRAHVRLPTGPFDIHVARVVEGA